MRVPNDLGKLLVIALCSGAPWVAAESSSPEQLMGQWLNLEMQKGAMQSNWNRSRDNLDQRFILLDAEQKRLKEVLSQRTVATGEVDQRRLELLQRQEKLEQEQAQLDAQLKKYLQKAQLIQPRLPPPLSAHWSEKLALLGQENASASERLEHLLGLFKQFDEFNQRVALHIGALDIPDANAHLQPILTSQIYLGASQGWYVSDDGKAYGYGRPTSTGWKWWHGAEAAKELGRPLSAEAIARVRHILENPTTAEFISLPVKISQ
ncbi:MAG TPA: DUF3450 family protein [Marinagarivorans sp.]|nr:DUF3450 family protein [Marinagarivorans sp.]HNG59764.1 DUF3450 family protein [Cellvibrionaceae bacterium]